MTVINWSLVCLQDFFSYMSIKFCFVPRKWQMYISKEVLITTTSGYTGASEGNTNWGCFFD